MQSATPEPRHRITVNQPAALLRAAKDEIGSSSATEVITASLTELVARRRCERLLQLDLPDLTPGLAEKLRRPRMSGT